MPKVLVVDDDADLRLLLRHALRAIGIEMLEAADGAAGLELARARLPDAVILDRVMPGMDGMEILAQLRREPLTRAIRVLMLTARGRLSERVAGLEGGADDFLSKPFAVPELVARIRALLRRETPKSSQTYTLGELAVDWEGAEVRVGGAPVGLTVTEFSLLRVLIEADGKVLSRERLRDLVWGVGFAVTPRTIDVHFRRMRVKLGAAGALIKTVRGRGFMIHA